ncbi:GNAT family N-acetyltransferase [Litchfieldia alkalitelluris]|uniref:GNAT family N-acetyltransferase n=1 Tax=Litchfieldia alkalitelluris TaxID=304268 RepID=UPI001472A18D|nr:GNAT family N-acetyltransferase [Litchfieldia alkalitelluris]
MEFSTTDKWDEALWQKVRKIYLKEFEEGKPENIIKNMFSKGICFLHVLMEGQDTIAMALTGRVHGRPIMLIDYLAVRRDLQGKGIGLIFFEKIKDWALSRNFEMMLLEAECEQTPDNLARIRFWKKCKFELLEDYTHHYIWVPEPYKAMWQPLKPDAVPLTEGREAFRYITAFHRKSFRT